MFTVVLSPSESDGLRNLPGPHSRCLRANVYPGPNGPRCPRANVYLGQSGPRQPSANVYLDLRLSESAGLRSAVNI